MRFGSIGYVRWVRKLLLVVALAALACSASASGRVEEASATRAAPRPLQLVATCVTRAERRRVVRFVAADRTRLIGVELGSGKRGVVLAHGYRQSVCDWIRQARRLARAGYRVLVFDHRNHGSSTFTRKRYWRIDHDVVGAVKTLRRRGATTVVLAGSSMGATAVLVGASEVQPAVDGVVSLSAPTHISNVDAEQAVRRLSLPTLFVAGDQDDPFDDDAQTLFSASVAREKQLEIVSGSAAHGTGLLGLASVRALFDEFLRTHSD
jgi:pimeloyl-ACP methyl ester carboxylesterase